MDRWNRRLSGTALAALVGVLTLPTVSFGQNAGPPQYGGTMLMVLPQEPGTVNPAISNLVPDMTVGCQIYQSMVDLDGGFRPKPVLAKSWTVSPDALTYTFDLFEAKWHDGKPFTSADVKFSLLEVSSKLKSSFQSAAKVIDSIETPDPRKVVIKLKQPFGPFLMSLACEQGGALLPKHLFEGSDPLKNPASSSAPIGTGPFKMTEWKRGDYIRLVKSTDYWEPGKPYHDEIVVKIITQAAARIQALQAGEVDLVQAFPANSMDAVKSDPKLKVEASTQTPSINWAFFNTTKKPFDDKRVRQAIMMATDRDYIVKNAFFSIGSVGVAPITTEFAWLTDPAIDYRKMYPFDPAKANALLDEAGVKRGPDGKRFSMKVTTYVGQYPEFIQVASAMKSMWQAVGIEANSDPMEGATLVKRVFEDRDFDFTLLAYGTLGDPALGVARAFTKAGIGRGFGNPSGYSKPEVDALFLEGERAATLEGRGEAYKKVQAILADDLPGITLRQYNQNDAATKKLQGIWGQTRGDGRFVEAWFTK